MCYMTRQLFPSPSQGALICAGGGKEGRLAAGRAVEPGGRTQLCTPGLDWLPCGFLHGFQTLEGSSFWRPRGGSGGRARPSPSSECPLDGTAGPRMAGSTPKQRECVSRTQRLVSRCLTQEGGRTCIVSRGVRG